MRDRVPADPGRADHRPGGRTGSGTGNRGGSDAGLSAAAGLQPLAYLLESGEPRAMRTEAQPELPGVADELRRQRDQLLHHRAHPPALGRMAHR